MKKEYIPLKKLKVYKLSRELSSVVWEIYQELDWRDKKTMGEQFVRATDSVGANIAEGYGRYHFLDRARFYFNSRGSLFESKHWLELLSERKKLKSSSKEEYLECYENLRPALNGLINSTMEAKNKKEIS